MNNLYVGYVFRFRDESKVLVSIAAKKQRAGDLMEEWLSQNDPDQLDYAKGGVATIEKDFIDLQVD